jgi:hypothetical protein
MDDVAESLAQIISEKVNFPKPKLRTKKKTKKPEPIIERVAKESGPHMIKVEIE